MAAEDTAPIDLASGRRLSPGVPKAVEEDTPRSRRHEDSNELSRALIEKLDGLIRTKFEAGLPTEAKEVLAAEATRLVERAWSSRDAEAPGAGDTQYNMRMPGAAGSPSTGRRWAIVAGALALFIVLGLIGFTASIMSLRMDMIEQQHAQLQSEATRRQQETDARLNALAAALADDAEYNRIVANWLVEYVESDNENAKNLDAMMRMIATKVHADVSGIAPPTAEHLPTAVNKKKSAYDYLDRK